MCCGTTGHHGCRHWGHHGSGHPHAGSCCFGTAHQVGRCFPTKEEKLTWMEQYLESLQNETTAVEEHIAKLKEEK